MDTTEGRAAVRVPAAALWTAETPSLYTLQLDLLENGRAVYSWRERIGLRAITVAGKRLLVNGRSVKLRGVNRHDLAPDVGRAVTERHFRRDWEVMKQGNINFIRTSHYPPSSTIYRVMRRVWVLCHVRGFHRQGRGAFERPHLPSEHYGAGRSHD